MSARKISSRNFFGLALSVAVIFVTWTDISSACIVPERGTNFDDFALRSDVVVEAISTHVNAPRKTVFNATFRVTHLFSSKRGSLKIGEEFEAGEFGGTPKCSGPKFGSSFILFLSSVTAPDAPWLSKQLSLRFNPVASSGRNIRFFEDVISGTYTGDVILRSGCKQLNKPDNGFISCAPNKKRCAVTCKKGFKLGGIKFKTCQPTTGWWHPFKPVFCMPFPITSQDIAPTRQAVEISTFEALDQGTSNQSTFTSKPATTATTKRGRGGKWKRRGAGRRRPGQRRTATGFQRGSGQRRSGNGRGRLWRAPTSGRTPVAEEKVPKKKWSAKKGIRRKATTRKSSTKPFSIAPMLYTAPQPLRSSISAVRLRPTLPFYRPTPTWSPVPSSVAVLKKVPNKPIIGEELDNIDDKFAVAAEGDEWEGDDGLTYKPELAVNKTVYGCPRYESNLTVFSFWPGGYNAMVNFSRLTKPIQNGWIVRVELESPIQDIETHAVDFYVGTEDATIITFKPKAYLAILHYNQDLTVAFIAKLNTTDARVPRGKGYLLGKCLDEEVYEKVVGNMFQGHKVVTSYGPDSKPQDVPVAPTRGLADPKTAKPTAKLATKKTPPPRRGTAPRKPGGVPQKAKPKSTGPKGNKPRKGKGQQKQQQQRKANTRSAFTASKPVISWKENRCLPESANGAAPKGGFTRPDWTKLAKQKSEYDYNEVLHKSGLFYLAQRSGKISNVYPIPWRADSAVKDGCDAGLLLYGGLYNGGGHEKSTIAIAYTTTMLAWGGIDYKSAYEAAGEYENLLKLIKTNARYLIRCHTSAEELVVQVGKHDSSGATWSRPEDMSAEDRVVYKVNSDKPGQDVAAETAAALAASAILLKTKDQELSKECIRHAKELYIFARKYPGQYSRTLTASINNYYTLSDTLDDMIWALLWIGKASGSSTYLAAAEKMFVKLPKDQAKTFYWADKTIALPILLAKFTKKKEYRGQSRRVILDLRNATKIASKQVWLSDEGPNMHTANAAFLALQSAFMFRNTPFASIAGSFAETQLHLLLGDSGRSYVVGFGNNSPKRPRHMGSSCMDLPAKCDSSVLARSADNAHILHGALVGGPDKSGGYRDLLTEKVYNEVAIDFNAGFQSAIAGLKEMKLPGKSPISNGPSVIRRIGQPVRKNNG